VNARIIHNIFLENVAGADLSKWNIASFSKDEQDKVSVDKAAAAVAWQERMNKPVVHELVEREQPEHLREYFRERLRVHRLNSQQLPRAMRPNTRSRKTVAVRVSLNFFPGRDCGAYVCFICSDVCVQRVESCIYAIPSRHDVMGFRPLCRLHYCQYNCRQTASVVRYCMGMAAAVIVAFMLNGAEPDEENRVLISTFACLVSAWYAGVQFRKERESLS
jgi:DNA polymerase-3 subunit theta